MYRPNELSRRLTQTQYFKTHNFPDELCFFIANFNLEGIVCMVYDYLANKLTGSKVYTKDEDNMMDEVVQLLEDYKDVLNDRGVQFGINYDDEMRPVLI